jgi:thiamine biosynthesis lipoprotein
MGTNSRKPVTFMRLYLRSLIFFFAPFAFAEVVERQVYLMGTSLQVKVQAASKGEAQAAAEAAIRAVETAEERLSTWRQDTELAAVNASSQPVVLSPLLCAELQQALYWAKETQGAFDPTVGWLVRAYDLRGRGRWPRQEELAAALEKTGYAKLILQDCRLQKTQGLLLEEGGFGKGAALDAALAAAKPKAQAVQLNFGGQVAYAGPGPWVVALRHPREDKVVALWEVPPGSVATSGNGQRGRWLEGRFLSHILDPRSGLPAADFGSVSLWAPSALTADCLSTALFVLGAEAGLRWLASHPPLQAVFLLWRGEHWELIASPGVQGRIRLLDPHVVWHTNWPAKASKKGEKP